MTTGEIDPKGISLIENFLDLIEDSENGFLDEYQLKFEGVLSKYNANGSEEYHKNKSEAEKYLEKRGEVKAGKTNDGIDDCFYKGDLDNFNLPTGPGTLTYSITESFTGTFEHGAKYRTGVRMYSGGDVVKIQGTWINGFLDGEARIEFTTGGYMEGFYQYGVLHGVSRTFGIGGYLKEISYHVLGVRRGWVYQGLLGGGYLIGQVDSNGDMTGDDFAFIYPDFRTAIRGRWENGQMISGQECRVISSIISDDNSFIIPVYSDFVNDVIYNYDPATHLSISRDPLLRDPWEATMVEVRRSDLDQAGEGLFAKVDLPAKTIICLFAGVRLKSSTVAGRERARSDYRIQLTVDIDLDIPDTCLQLSSYCATLGHKANHSFTPNGTFDLFEHPRFGLIRAISSQQDIKAGEEITVNYYIGLSIGPEWYKRLWLKHVRQDKKWGDKEIQRFLERNYDMTMKKIELPDEGQLCVPKPVGALNLDEEE